ncbi:BRCT domain-containing protein [Desulfobacterales bacterium HSG16]|nr:BRCT domain-containing protein [Desulfobacterales bacterium HSG16]
MMSVQPVYFQGFPARAEKPHTDRYIDVSAQLCLKDLYNAIDAADPQLAEMIESLSAQPDPEPETPLREGARSFDRFMQEIRTTAFRSKPREEQAMYRMEQIKALEADNAEIPLSDRLKLHEIINALWENQSPFARNCLLEVIATVRLTYGPWRALKAMAKQAEASNDTEILGALGARFDMALADGSHEISKETLGYMCRRIWRYLRHTGQSLPVCYADAATDVLAKYTDKTAWSRTWIANHILFHKSGKYSRRRFVQYSSSVPTMLKQRAFPRLWKRSPQPLLSLLERADSTRVLSYAATALKNDFKAMIRDIEPGWVARLVSANRPITDEFVIWLLANVPKFEQSAFRELKIHDSVLLLFDSKSSKARIYAAEYARTYARDLPVSRLIQLANNSELTARKLAADLLMERDPRKEVGLDAWGRLLETRYGHDLAAKVLKKSFTARELTPEWFVERLLSGRRKPFQFAEKLLLVIHPAKKLGPDFFYGLVRSLDEKSQDTENPLADDVMDFVFNELARFDIDLLDAQFLKQMLLHPLGRYETQFWIEEERLKPEILGAEFFKILAYHPDWEASQWVADIKKSGLKWAEELQFDAELSQMAMELLKDVRRFSATDLGFDWLMQLIKRAESRYHDFAVSVMVRSFIPADFVKQHGEKSEKKKAKAKTKKEEKLEIKADFKESSFVFTGKLATMTRKQALDMVKQANGRKASGVTGKLDYLVIGDEGSSLYGSGRKGSKQVKAEKLIEKGATIKIISETAFLQMLAGKTSASSDKEQLAGCVELWNMATGSTTLGQSGADDPLQQFAMTYILSHHPDICLAETDRPVDPGAEIPAQFLNFARVSPLFFDEQRPIRTFALKLAQWEFARWNPGSEYLVKMCESSYEKVRAFVIKSFLAEDELETRRYRLDPSRLDIDAVYQFCESVNNDIRIFGIKLVGQYPDFQKPEPLFGLTESTDRRIRALAVKTLWTLYRNRGITDHWQYDTAKDLKQKPKSKKAKSDKSPVVVSGPAPKPEKLPASRHSLREVLRRLLFEISPGRLEKEHTAATSSDLPYIKPLSTRKAKLCLIQTLQDLSIEDKELAEEILPLLIEFSGSRGMSEQAACLVAVTRIYKAYPDMAKVYADQVISFR